MALKEVVTPVETGVQLHGKKLNLLDSGACPGPDSGFAGITKKGNFGLFAKPSSLTFRISLSFG
jgi:hypothetical protein